MKNVLDILVLSFLFLSTLTTEADALMCYQSTPASVGLKRVDCGPRRSCFIYETVLGELMGCACRIYPTGVIRVKGLRRYYCNHFLCNGALPA